MSTLQITPLDGPLGATVTGLDLRRPLSGADEHDLHAALADRLLVVVPEQFLDLDDERRVAESFGPLWEHPAARHRPGRGTAAVLDNRGAPEQARRPAEVWHADATFTTNPPAYTVLSAQVVPDHGGGTSFANQQLAYTRLDDAWRDRLDGLRAVHAPGPRQLRQAPWLTESIHPVVRVDAETGRRSLFVNPGFTRRFEHLTVQQSRPYLGALFRVALDPEVRYDHQWRAGDLVIWDNRALLHRAHHDDYGDEARVLARVTVAA